MPVGPFRRRQSVKRILQVTLQSDNTQPLPGAVSVDFYRQNVLQETDSYSTSGLAPGDPLTLAVQRIPPVATGLYHWRAVVHVPGQADLNTSGVTYVRAEDGSPYGSGWTFSNVQRLVPMLYNPQGGPPTGVGVLWLPGDGQWRFYSDTGNGYVSPEDSGLLTGNAGSGWTYTSPEMDQTFFNGAGLETRWLSASGASELDYSYDGQGRLASFRAIDGSTTTFNYDNNGLLSAIHAPGGRTYTVTMNGTDLQSITDPDGRQEAFTYSGEYLLTAVLGSGSDKLTNRWSYDAHDLGQKWTWGMASSPSVTQVTPAARAGLDGLAALWVRATTLDPNGGQTLTTMDSRGRAVAEEDANGGLSTWTLDSAGRIVGAVDPLGRSSSYGRDDFGYVTRANTPDGLYLYAYDATFHQLMNAVDPNNHADAWPPNGLSHPSAYNDAAGDQWHFTWNGDLLAQVTDPRSRVTSYAYDSYKRLMQVTDPIGVTKFGYDQYGNVNLVVDRKNRNWTEVNDSEGRPQSATAPDGSGVSWQYNTAGLLSLYTDEIGIKFLTKYDTYGRGLPVTEVDALGTKVERTHLTRYDNAGQVIGERAANGGWTKFDLNALGWITKVTDALGDTEKSMYDWAGRQRAGVDWLAYFWSFAYDSGTDWFTAINQPDKTQVGVYRDGIGSITQVTEPDGAWTQLGYAPTDLLSAVQDDLGHLTTVAYWPDQQLKSITDALNVQTQWVDDPTTLTLTKIDGVATSLQRQEVTTFDRTGNAIKQTNGLGQTVWQQVLDLKDQLYQSSNGIGGTITYQRNARGDITDITNELGGDTTLVPDELGRDRQTTSPVGGISTVMYSAIDQVVVQTDPLGRKSQNIYDLLGQPLFSISPLGAIVAQRYDPAGNESSLTDPDGNQTTWRDNFHDEAVEETSPLGTRRYTYDVDGRLSKVVDRLGRSEEYAYLNNGWLASITWKDAQGNIVGGLSYAYDQDGRVIQASNSDLTYQWTYDALGRVTKQSDSRGITLFYTYDAADNLIKVTDSFGGEQDYSWDANGDVTSTTFTDGATSLREDYTYNAAGQVASSQRASDLAGANVIGTSSYAYDLAERLTSITHKDGQGNTLDAYQYTYDLADQVTQEASLLGGTRNFGYNADGQLSSDGTGTYNWDLNGNPQGTGVAVGPANELLSDGNWNLTYDAEGNLTGKISVSTGEEWTYRYNNANELVSGQHRASVSAPVDKEVDFKYDPMGEKIEEDVLQGGTTTITKYAWDRGNLFADLNASSSLTSRHLYLNMLDSLFASIGNGQTTWYLEDIDNSVRDATNASGALLDHLDYDGWGKLIHESNPGAADRFQYTKREWDVEIQMQYNRERWYDPSLRRWITQDPTGFNAGDNNLYRYVHNQPSLSGDPSGLEPPSPTIGARALPLGPAFVGPPAPTNTGYDFAGIPPGVYVSGRAPIPVQIDTGFPFAGIPPGVYVPEPEWEEGSGGVYEDTVTIGVLGLPVTGLPGEWVTVNTAQGPMRVLIPTRRGELPVIRWPPQRHESGIGHHGQGDLEMVAGFLQRGLADLVTRGAYSASQIVWINTPWGRVPATPGMGTMGTIEVAGGGGLAGGGGPGGGASGRPAPVARPTVNTRLPARVTQELPAGQARTPAEVAQARNFFKRNRAAAEQWWEQRTGQQWPANATHAEHPRPLADGGDPLFIEPAFGGPNAPHMVPGPDGLTEFQRWGMRGGRPPNQN
jgi:RHS repeat-associated protein